MPLNRHVADGDLLRKLDADLGSQVARHRFNDVIEDSGFLLCAVRGPREKGVRHPQQEFAAFLARRLLCQVDQQRKSRIRRI